MKRGHDGVWRTVGGVAVSKEQQRELEAMTDPRELIERATTLAATDIDALIDAIESDCFSCNDGISGSLGDNARAMISALATAFSAQAALIAEKDKALDEIISADRLFSEDEVPGGGITLTEMDGPFAAIARCARNAGGDDE